MSKFELTKSIEARKLNPRTGIPTTDPPVTVPFGAILEDVVEDREDRKFSYLGLRFQCTGEVFRASTVAVGGTNGEPEAEEAAPVAAAAEPVAPEPAASVQPAVCWEKLTSNWKDLMRLKVPGGWLVALGGVNASPSFYPDRKHQWR